MCNIVFCDAVLIMKNTNSSQKRSGGDGPLQVMDICNPQPPDIGFVIYFQPFESPSPEIILIHFLLNY